MFLLCFLWFPSIKVKKVKWPSHKRETNSLNLLCYMAFKISTVLLHFELNNSIRKIRRVHILNSAFPPHLKNPNVWLQRSHCTGIPLPYSSNKHQFSCPLFRNDMLLPVCQAFRDPVRHYICPVSRMRIRAGLVPLFLDVCPWAPLHTFIHVGSIWVTCTSHNSTSQFHTNPSLWSLEGIDAF